MATRPLPCRLPSQASHSQRPSDRAATLPRLWPSLSGATQAQLAHVFAQLLRRMHPTRTAIEESPRADRFECS